MVNPNNMKATFGENTNMNKKNTEIKARVDQLIKEIKSKTTAIISLQEEITDTAVITRWTINDGEDLRGKNIFIAQPIEVGNILDYLVPFGIQDSSLLNRGFKQIANSLSKIEIESALYSAANTKHTDIDSVKNVYLSMQAYVPLATLTSNIGGYVANETNVKLYSSSASLSNNLSVQNYNFYILDNESWSVEENISINFLGLGFNGMIYIGTLPTETLDNAITAAGKLLNPNVLEPLIKEYNNIGALPQNNVLLDYVYSQKNSAQILISTYENNIASVQALIKDLKTEKQDEKTQIQRANTQIAKAKAQEKEALSGITQNEHRLGNNSFDNFWLGVEDFFYSEEQIIDATEIVVETERKYMAQEVIEGDNKAINLLNDVLALYRQKITSKTNDLTQINSEIYKILNPPKVMKMQNYNSSTAPSNNIRNESQEFNAGYTRTISWLGCYRDGVPRAIATQQGNKNYYDCAAKAREVGSNIFALQWGGSYGDEPQCFTDLQAGPDFPAATMYPGSTNTIMGSTASSNVKPQEYTCVSDQNTPNIYYGGAWTNATYQVAEGYFSEITLIGLNNASSKYPPGTLILDIKATSNKTGASLTGFPKHLQEAPRDNFIKKENLIPFSTKERGYRPSTAISSEDIYNNFIGTDITYVRYLYSPDYYFRLVLSGTGPGAVQVNIKTSASGADIASKRTHFNKIQEFVQNYSYANPSKNLDSIYYLDLSVNNLSLGELGFISYDSESSTGLGKTANNPYKINFYNNGSDILSNTSNAQDSQFEFLKLKGSLSKTTSQLTKLDNISDINACKQYCYGDVNNCTAWQYNELESGDNSCLITSQTNLNDILSSTAWSAAQQNGGESEFHIRMPTKQNVPDGCPPFNKANVIVARVPIRVKNSKRPLYTTSVVNHGTISDFYYVVDTASSDNLRCNVDKEISPSMTTLEELKQERQNYVRELNSLLSKMSSAEQKIYRKLLQNQEYLNTNIGEYNILKTDLDYLNNESNVSITMAAAVDDSMMQLIDNNYEYMLWTILAIVIVIIAINLAKK